MTCLGAANALPRPRMHSAGMYLVWAPLVWVPTLPLSGLADGIPHNSSKCHQRSMSKRILIGNLFLCIHACLQNTLPCAGQHHLSASAAEFGSKAWDLRALQYVAGMLHDPGMKMVGHMADLCRRPLQRLLTATLAAVALPPATLTASEMSAIVQWIEGVFTGELGLARTPHCSLLFPVQPANGRPDAAGSLWIILNCRGPTVGCPLDAIAAPIFDAGAFGASACSYYQPKAGCCVCPASRAA